MSTNDQDILTDYPFGGEGASVLIINDLCGYGKVATNAMLPVLSYLGVPTFNLPTALVSNNLEYGKFAILETTDYIKQTFRVWKELGFHYDAIATGFMASEHQAEIIADYCREQAQSGTAIFVDPIMGDEGKLYNGITAHTVLAMRRMISVAHLCFPNYTEACYLTDTEYKPQGVTRDEAYALMDKLHKIGARSVIITSIPIDGVPSVVVAAQDTAQQDTAPKAPQMGRRLRHDLQAEKHSNEQNILSHPHIGDSCGAGAVSCWALSYDEIPVRIPGTGDIFSAIVIARLFKGDNLKTATRHAMDNVRTLIDLNKTMPDKYRGIPLERYLYVFDE